MIRVLAIDDEPLALKQLEMYIAKVPYLELVAACHSAMEARRVSALVESLSANGMLAPHARVLYERASDAPGLDLPAARLAKSKSHGISAVDLLIME